MSRDTISSVGNELRESRQFNKITYEKLVLSGGALVTLIGVMGIGAHLFHYPLLGTFLPNSPFIIGVLTSVALILLGLGVCTILDTQPKYSKWLWPMRYVACLVPISLGFYYLITYWNWSGFDLFKPFILNYPQVSPTFLSSLCLFLSGIGLFSFLIRPKRHSVTALSVDILALFTFNLSLFSIAGHLLNIHILFNFRMSFPAALGFMLTSLTLLIANIPYQGILAPLVDKNPRVKALAYVIVLTGFSIMIYGVTSIALAQLRAGEMDVNVRTMFIVAELATNGVAILIKTAGLRAVYYYSESSKYAQQQQEKAAQELTTRQIIEAVHSTANIDEAFQKIVDYLGTYLKSDRCFIARYNDRDNELIPPVREHLSSPVIESTLSPRPELWEKLCSFAKTTCTQDAPIEFASETHGVSEEAAEEHVRLKVQSGLGVSIKYRGNCLGVLFIHQVSYHRDWTQSEKDIIQVVARQVGVAIYQSELYENEQIRARQLEVVAQFNQLALSGASLPMLLNECTRLVADTLNLKFAKVLQLVPGTENHFVFRAQIGFKPELIGQEFDPEYEPHGAYTINTRHPVVVDDIYQETRFSPSPLHSEFKLISGITVIIYGNMDEPFGILQADSQEKRFFTQNDVNFMQAMANILGVAIERKKVEQAVTESEERLQLALDASGSVGTWDWDFQTNRLVSDTRFASLFLVDPEEAAKGVSLEEYIKAIHPDDKERVIAAVEMILKTGGDYREEYRLLQSDGSTRWIVARGQCKLDYAGRPVRFPGIVIDITDRKRAEQALVESEARLRAMFEQTSVGIAMLDTNIRFLHANNRYCELVGRSLKELRELTAYDITHPDDRALHIQQLNNLIETGEGFHTEKRYVRPDSSEVWVHISVSGMLDERGRITNILGIAQDITERKRAEAAAIESEERFQVMANASPTLIALSDASGNATFFNKAWEEFTGKSQEKLLRYDWLDVVHPDDKARFIEVYDQALRNQQPFQVEFRLLRHDGIYRWVLGDATPRWTPDGQFQGYVGLNLDITERKQMENALLESRQKLAESNRDLEHFAIIASHDLQAPLRKVRFFSEQLLANEKEHLKPESIDMLNRIHRSIGNAQNLIHDLLALAKVSKVGQPFTQVNLTQVVNRVLINLDEQIREKRAEIHVGQLVTLHGDPRQLEQLLQNLVENGLKYQHRNQKPIIQIHSECMQNYCTIIVEDNGIGFDMSHAERIFQPFERLHEKAGLYSGTGVGLAICKRIVERHGGTIDVQSEPGKGSVFRICLPYQPRKQRLQEDTVAARDT